MDAIDKINFYLSKKGKNGADLSRALGLSNSIYSQWNTRKTKPSNARLPAIAEYLGVSVEDIMPDDVAAPAASEGAKKALTKTGERENNNPVTQEIFEFVRSASVEELAEVVRYIQFLKTKRVAK